MIELPRNFQFIHRLPEMFEMSVLTAGNIVGQTRWYEVLIAGHHLNILSRVDLAAGKNYQIKKRGPLKLEVLGEAPKSPFTGILLEPIEPDSPLPGPEPGAAIKLISQLPGKEFRAYQTQNGYLFEILFEDQAMLYLFFMPEKDGWALFSAQLPTDSPKQTEPLTKELLEAAGICQYKPTSPGHIKALITGFQGIG